MKARVDTAERKMKRLQQKIMTSTRAIGINTKEDLHNELKHIMRNNREEIQKQFPENSFSECFGSSGCKIHRVSVTLRSGGTH